ncbi:MAG: tRNA (5-methylaminomethyl-2-thiouridylate)-methyltransferase [Acidobacteria bacterium]|nr:tRNA (5-methylaminomethyl-2-thiouridylate)-methyltransferase [Acidobacteriota bacterium]
MKIAVAMSGGVDSSAAAYILKSAGHDVVGLSMQMYDNLRNSATEYGGCCTIDDLADARRVAWKLDIPHFILNLEENFHEKVITPFVQGYLSGTTPSPCVLCNTHVKFDLFHRKAQAIGAEKIATGHYARLTHASDGRIELRKANDLAKDQTYFLFELSQEQLGDAIFPLGELTKPEVRAIAAEGGLSVAKKKESYEICFVPQKDGYGAIVEREAGITPGEGAGEIVDVEGNVVGHHDGYYHFTIGQRRGLQVGGTPDRTYVVDVNPFTKRVTIGPGSVLERSELVAERVHWISGEPPTSSVEVQARVRSRSADVAATVTPIGDGRARVSFAQTLRAIAPGQAVVFYDNDLCLGGGWITR